MDFFAQAENTALDLNLRKSPLKVFTDDNPSAKPEEILDWAKTISVEQLATTSEFGIKSTRGIYKRLRGASKIDSEEETLGNFNTLVRVNESAILLDTCFCKMLSARAHQSEQRIQEDILSQVTRDLEDMRNPTTGNMGEYVDLFTLTLMDNHLILP